MICGDIDPASVDVLQAVLARLKNVESNSSGQLDNLWGCTMHQQNAYLTNEDQFLEAMHALRQLRESQRTLSLLLSSVERTLASLRSETYLAVLSNGINWLPDEVLGHIFALSASSSWRVAWNLSGVSRRFRSIAFATPRLWATLPTPRVDEVGCAIMRQFLTLSRNVGLSVELPLLITETNEENPDWGKLLGMIIPHKHRWKHLTVDLAMITYEIEDGEADHIEFPKATLDAVESLYIGDSPLRFSWLGYGYHDEYDSASTDFYASWKFPGLKSLTSEMHIPPPGVLPALTEFSLDFSIHEPLNAFNPSNDLKPSLDTLLVFLDSTRTLQSFKFVAGEYSYHQPELTATLPSLTKLHMESRYDHPISLTTMRELMHALRMPNLEDFSLVIDVAHVLDLEGDNGTQWLSDFFPDTQEHAQLKRISLEYTVAKSLADAALEHIDIFPALEEFEVRTSVAPSISETLAKEIRESVPLRRVRFSDARLGHESAVREYELGDEGVKCRAFFEPCRVFV